MAGPTCTLMLADMGADVIKVEKVPAATIRAAAVACHGRGIGGEVDHHTLGPVRTLGLPVKSSRTPGGPRFGAPVYGQHSREILEQHGVAGAEIEALIASGAVVAG